MVFGKNVLVKINISLFLPLVLLLFVTTLAQDDYSTWQYSTKVSINTTSGGANVTGDVPNFPALVRLTSTNFTFAQANANGSDIRFSKADGTHLPYEIERWDGTGQLAEIWVLVDNILGNNNQQFIIMYWGKASASDSSNSEAVFATSNNFAGVWHLDQNNFLDATSNNNNGTNSGTIDATGMIGIGKDFDGSDYINVGSNATLDNLPSITIEAWLYTDGWGGNSFGRIINKTSAAMDGMNFFVSNNTLNPPAGVEALVYLRDRDYLLGADTTRVRSADGAINLAQWQHAVVVMNGTSSIRLYINGAEPTPYRSQAAGSGAFTGVGNDALYDMYIGNTQNYDRTFDGRIDEVRVSNSARSANWIKLSYETQRSGQNTVTIATTQAAEITSQPQSDTVGVSEPVSFTVVAIGIPAPTYQWETDASGAWANIGGATSATYTIASSTTAHSGNYRVTATNASGSELSSVANLLVTTTPPSFQTHPQPDTVHVGEPVSFTATASGSPAPTYQWQTDASGSWVDISGATGTTYNIPSATLANTGNYRSVATNIAGSDISNIAYLLVYDSTNIINSHPENDTVLAGGTAIFGITANGSALSYQWQRIDGGWHDITPGGDQDTLSLTAGAGDDRVSFRCVVTSGPVNDTSNFAMLYIATIPTITSSFSSDTVLPVGGNLTLTGSASSFPDPGYEWFFIYPGSAPASKGTGTTLSLTSVAKTDSGTYYFVASNAFGSTSSDSIFVHVLTPVSITINLPTTYNVIHGGAATLNILGSGDGTISYQWYESDTALSGQTSNSLSINPVDSAVHNGNTYHCVASNSFLSTAVGTARSVTCTLVVSDFYNPFKIKAERIDIHNTTQVRVKLWSEVDISSFPTVEPFPGVPWADSVWVIYTSSNYPASISQPNVAFAQYSTEEIKQAADTVVKTLTVAELISGGLQPFPHDSNYYFSNSVKWHNPDTLLAGFVPGNPVFMLDTLAAPNLLVVHGQYVKRDTVKITIDSIAKLNASSDSLVVVQSSKLPDFSTLFFTDTFSVPALIAGGTSHTYALIDSVDNFPLASVSGLDTVYCRWFTIGTNTAVTVKLDTAYAIGWPRPVYSGILTADSTFLGDQMHLQWTSPQAGTDSLRIWYNTAPIPLVYDPTAGNTFYPASGVAIDTLTGLTDSTLYFFGLQILKDEMWSVITNASSDTMWTGAGNPDTVPNVISVDSTRFDATRNSMRIYWHIDLSTIPSGMYYQSSYTFEADSTLDTINIKPVSWDSVRTADNMTEIVLYPDIYFDTTYSVGMWLRGYNPSQGGPTKPAYPTDSSLVFVPIPSFTWQEVNFFPDSTVEFAANQKIILKEINHFEHKDTLWSFNPGTLPYGFVSVGSVSFSFGNKNPGIAPFNLGLKYNSVLPTGITESDLAMYRVINGEFFILYGFKVENGAVWKTITSDSMAYPFIALADTMAPEVKVAAYNDTIVRGSNVPNWFSVNDNVANTHWKLTYGQGNEAYVKSTEGFLSKSFDTANQLLEYMDSSVINESFGVRALILAEDGIRSDTDNVSRCVENTTGESFSVGSNEWVPLRTRSGLYERSLDAIFDRSVVEPDPWEYDIYQWRIYRWHTTDSSGDNTWLEYSDAVKGEFDFVPGRLIWSKAAEDQRIDFGSGVTTTLKESYRITLKPKNWTDITLPFQFPVMLRDVLEATTPYYDSLEVYHWKKDSTGYSAHDLYIFAFDDLDSAVDTLVSYQKYDGYTVYNHYDTDVTLLIPPTCLALSRYSTRQLTEESTEKSVESWDISFNWKDANAGESSFFKRVRCGYKSGEGKTIFGSLPPSMSKIQVGVLDNSGRHTCGWALKQGFDKNGGVAFEIILDNKSKTSTDIEYYIDKLHVLPKGFKARVYDAKSGEYRECSADNVSTVTVESNGSVRRLIAIGPEDYFSSLFAAFMPMKLLKIYPNPFNGLIKIHYRIPLGIKEVQFSLYNVQGRLLWRGVKGKYLEAGENIFYLNSNNLGANRALPAGVYIMRLSAKNASGKTLYGGEKRITCIK